MLLRIYALIWVLVIAAAGILFVTGNSDEVTLTILGFVSATLFFAGLLGVLPWMMEEHYSRYVKKHRRPFQPRVKRAFSSKPAYSTRFRNLRHAAPFRKPVLGHAQV
jgi:hypothetical protein